MNVWKKSLVAVASASALSIGLAGGAQAGQTDITLLDVYGDFNGDTLVYEFQGLPQATDDGVLRLFTGVSQAGGSDGLDLTGIGDFFNLIIDGNDLGRFSCDENSGSSLIPGCTPSTLHNEFDVSFNFSELGLDLLSLVADSSLLVQVAFSDNVNLSSDNDELFVQLTYEDVVQSVPEPASMIALLAIGSIQIALGHKKKDEV